MTEEQTYYLIALAFRNLYKYHDVEKSEVDQEIKRISDGMYNIFGEQGNEENEIE